MSNQPNPNNVQRGVRIPRDLDAKVLKRFRFNDAMSVSNAYILALEFATVNVELSAEDYERIAEEVRTAKSKKGTK